MFHLRQGYGGQSGCWALRLRSGQVLGEAILLLQRTPKPVAQAYLLLCTPKSRTKVYLLQNSNFGYRISYIKTVFFTFFACFSVPLPSPCPPPCEHGGGTKFEVLSVVNSMFLFLFPVPCLPAGRQVLYSRISQAFAVVYPIEAEILQVA